MSNQLTKMAKELLTIEIDLPFRMKWLEGGGKNEIDNFSLHVFDQVWGSTALGFGGAGGQALTTARTYVFIPDRDIDDNCYVYFGDRFAYAVPFSEGFFTDVKNGNVASVMGSCKYKRGEEA